VEVKSAGGDAKSRAENIKAIFSWMDTNKDGVLVASEMKKFADSVKAASLEKLMALADLNADKKVTLEEFTVFIETLLRRSFTKIDENKNGKIDTSELSTMVLIMIEGQDFTKLTSAYIEGLRDECSRVFGAKSATFDQFADYLCDLLAVSLFKCVDKAGAIPLHVTNLVNFSVSGGEWAKLTGSVTLELREKEANADAEMDRKIKAAMEMAFAAEKKKAETERKAAEDERKRLEERQRSSRLEFERDRFHGADRMRHMKMG